MWTSSNHPGGWGRRWRYHDTALRRLTCWGFQPNRLAAKGQRVQGIASWQDPETGERAAAIQWQLEAIGGLWRLTLDYQANGVPVSVPVMLMPDAVAKTTRVRWWFTCPDCTRRCGVLFLIPRTRRFTCRYCGSVTYSSRQREHPARLELALLTRLGRLLARG